MKVGHNTSTPPQNVFEGMEDLSGEPELEQSSFYKERMEDISILE